MSASQGISDYILHTADYPSASATKRVAVLAMALALSSSQSRIHSKVITDILSLYFETDITPNMNLPDTKEGHSCWQLFLRHMWNTEAWRQGRGIHYHSYDSNWRLPAIAFFILKGADPRVWLSIETEMEGNGMQRLRFELEHRGQETTNLQVSDILYHV
ncbi:hypothetical protein BJY04DRAFT_217759 [Aspergillus karnatakaensis]|uniref:uncharacterized protein n=1 Tax=Aspergillus karnatakaensis TaxID=1810916 RepID=UPI003CCCA105